MWGVFYCSDPIYLGALIAGLFLLSFLHIKENKTYKHVVYVCRVHERKRVKVVIYTLSLTHTHIRGLANESPMTDYHDREEEDIPSPDHSPSPSLDRTTISDTSPTTTPTTTTTATTCAASLHHRSSQSQPRMISLVCPHCGKQFIGDATFSGIRSNYTRHLRIHTGQRPFPCQLCGEAFTTSTNLRRHISLVHHGKRLPVLHRRRQQQQEGGQQYYVDAERDKDEGREATTTPTTPTSEKSVRRVGTVEDMPLLDWMLLRQELFAAAARHAESQVQPLGPCDWRCPLCSRVFTSLHARATHQQECTVNLASPALSTSSSLPSSPISPGGGAGSLVCAMCEAEVSSKAALRRHTAFYCPFRDDCFADVKATAGLLGRASASEVGMLTADDLSRSPPLKHSRTEESVPSLTLSEEEEEDEADDEEEVFWGTELHSLLATQRRGSSHRRLRTILRRRWRAELERSHIIHPLESGSLLHTTVLARQYTPSPTSFVCPFDGCLEVFAKRRLWRRHVARMHPGSGKMTNGANTPPLNNPLP